MHLGRAGLAQTGKRQGSGRATFGVRYLLSAVAAGFLCPPAGIFTVSNFLGNRGGGGFSSVFHTECTKRSQRTGGVRFDHRQLYRVRHHHCQHSIAERVNLLAASPILASASGPRSHFGVDLNEASVPIPIENLLGLYYLSA